MSCQHDFCDGEGPDVQCIKCGSTRSELTAVAVNESLIALLEHQRKRIDQLEIAVTILARAIAANARPSGEFGGAHHQVYLDGAIAMFCHYDIPDAVQYYQHEMPRT